MHAGRLVERLYEEAMVLARFPNQGRPGVVPGTRELITTPLPWVIVYVVDRRRSRLFVFCMALKSGSSKFRVQQEF